jgi:16S rRNA (guanine527-N7)-methyltransferase
LSPEEFAESAGVPRGTLERFRTYHALLTKWQRAINLVGPRTLGDAWRRHFLDSAQLWPLVAEAAQGRAATLADLGSGAGFPGLVLAIMAAGHGVPLTTHLIEADQRKAAFLIEVARATGTVVMVHADRAESIGNAGIIAADIVTARALAPLADLLALAAPLLAPDGVCLFLKGAAVDDELTRARETWKMTVDRIPSRSDPSGTILRIRMEGRG